MHTTSIAPSSYRVTRLESVHHHHDNNRGPVTFGTECVSNTELRTVNYSRHAKLVTNVYNFIQITVISTVLNIKCRLCVLLNTQLQPSHIHTYLNTHQNQTSLRPSILRYCTPAQTDGESQHVFRNWMPLYLSGIYPHPTPSHLPSVANATQDTGQSHCRRSVWSIRHLLHKVLQGLHHDNRSPTDTLSPTL